MNLLLLSKNDSELVKSLKNQFNIEQVSDENDFRSKASSSEYAALVINLSEQSEAGNRLDLIEPLRAQKIFTPALAIKGPPNKMVTALEKGYDAYLGGNFSTPELVALLNALIRRSNYALESTTLTAGDLFIDLLKRQVRRGKKMIELQPREFVMLEYMMRNPGLPLTKRMLMENVWKYNFDPQTNIVDVLICRLRGKVEVGFTTPVIQTLRGVGYRFNPTT